jgi:hypothetical protein
MWLYHIFIFIFESFSYIIHLHFAPWPMIDNPTKCDRIMYSTLMSLHPMVIRIFMFIEANPLNNFLFLVFFWNL